VDHASVRQCHMRRGGDNGAKTMPGPLNQVVAGIDPPHPIPPLMLPEFVIGMEMGMKLSVEGDRNPGVFVPPRNPSVYRTASRRESLIQPIGA